MCFASPRPATTTNATRLDARGQELLAAAAAQRPIGTATRVRGCRGHARRHRDPARRSRGMRATRRALLDELAARFGLAVTTARPVSRRRREGPRTGCGKPGCGSESGGCSTLRDRRRLFDRLVLARSGEVGRRTDRVLRGPPSEDGSRRPRPHAAELIAPMKQVSPLGSSSVESQSVTFLAAPAGAQPGVVPCCRSR